MKFNLQQLVKETRYRVHPQYPWLSFSIIQSGDKWVVCRNTTTVEFPFRVMNGEIYGGGFDTLKEAQKEFRRILRYYYSPLKNSELMRYFTEDWIEKEEQSKELREFRSALYQAEYTKAARLYNQKLSNYTKEAIPDVVIFQIWFNLPTGKLKEKIS